MWRRAAERVGRMTLLTRGATLPDPGSSALRLHSLGTGGAVAARAALLRWWHAERPAADLLHDSQGFMLPLFAALGRGGPLRLTSDFTSTYDWHAHLRGQHAVEWRVRELRYWLQTAEARALGRLADAFTVFGEGHRAPFARFARVGVEQVHSIPNCVDPEGFSPDGPRADLGLDPGDPVLLFVGQPFRYKGIHELLEAVAALTPRFPRVRLLLVGSAPGGAEAIVRERVAALGLGAHVQLAGPRPRAELPGLMRAADVVVLPSYTEGSPRVLIEAMACARPIVGTDLPGIATLDPAGTCIRRVARADAPALAEALAATLADPGAAAEAGRRGRERFLRFHTPDAAGDALAALYQRLV
ncbi:MAG: glycosyltransferase family 4 protein, partial [bacterium]